MFETTSQLAQEDKPMSSNIPVDFTSAGGKPSKGILAAHPSENMNAGDDTSTISEFHKVEIVGGKAASNVNEPITVPARLKTYLVIILTKIRTLISTLSLVCCR